MIIEVKDFKGLATNVDPGDIGLEFSHVNENFRLDTPGTLTKQKGRGSNTDIASTRLTQLQYWSPSNLTTANAVIPSIWVGFDDVNNKIKKLNSNFATPLDVGTAIADVSSVDLNDHGQDFRIAPDNLNHSAKILQHISRKFFEGAITINEYIAQEAMPSLPTASQMFLDEITSLVVGADSGLSLGEASSATSYNYKISPIFDGFQELPLSNNFLSLVVADNTKAGKIKISFTNQTTGSGTAPNKTYGFNPRITSFKVYRETNNSGHYYELLEIPINTSGGSSNIIIDGSSSGSNSTALPGKNFSYSNTLIDNNTAVKASSGVFGTPNQTVPSGTLSCRYVWKHLQKLANGNLDSNSNARYASSPTIKTSAVASISGTTANFSAVAGPLATGTFTNFLNNGFLQLEVSSHPTDGASAFNFNTTTHIRRLLETTASYNGSLVTIYNSDYDFNHTLQNSVWHNKAIGYNTANANRWGPGGVNGYVSIDHNSGQHIVLDSVGKSVKLFDTSSFSVGQNIDLNKSYVLTVGSTNTTFEIYDVGYTNGVVQPYADEANIDTRYKYSQMIGDMHFVGNVRLDPSGNSEDHPDWVMYSETGQPDILPITNFIQILDQQGGYINGLNRILNNLVVFMTKGVFRLDVSSGEPSLFTLLEVNSSVGCIAPQSIVNAKDNLFFCAKDNMYQIRPDFTFVAISRPIEDVYQGISTIALSKVMYDIKRDRLICRFGSDALNIYCYDLGTQDWTKMVFNDGNFKQADFFTVNDDLGLHSVRVYDPNPNP